MSNINKEKNGDEESKEIASVPKSKVREILSELEVLSLQRGIKSSFDISKLDSEQFNRAMDLLKQNEQNAYDYHSKRLDVIKELESKRIDSSVIIQKTVRFVIITSVIILPIFTLLVLFYKENFFIPWLTFLTGFLGGAGFTKILSSYLKRTERKEPILDKED